MSETPEQETQVSAGEQLRHLREQQNFSIQDIASRLHLDPRVIEALENNQFELLPAATYARGYLRSYAKTLGVAPEGILAAYNSGAPEPPEIIPEVKHATQTSSSDKPVKAFTYLVTLTLAILLAAWLYSNFVVDNMSFEFGNLNTGEEASAPALGYAIPIVEHPDTPFYRAEDAMQTDSEPAPEAEPLAGEDGSAADTVAESRDTTDSEDAVTLAVANGEGPDSLILRMKTDSWVEVFDAADNKLFLNLAKQGQELSLRGTAPFTILLGFAEGVSVEFNGEAIDTTSHTRGSIARFTLNR